MSQARIEPTAAELLAAYERSRTPTWPATFAEAMADPVISRLIAIAAKHPPRAARPPAAQPASMHPARSPGTWRPATRPVIDRKRAAAGERDDD